MPIVSLKLIPGVNAEFTPALNESAIASCDKIRFKAKLPQKLGGWTRFYPFSLGGIPRSIVAWQDLNAADHLGVGTTTNLTVITDGIANDITPQTLETDSTPDFSTSSGTTQVTIVDAGINNVTTYDTVFFNTPISVGGILLHGAYAISVVGGATSYSINAVTNATSTVSNGGVVPEFDTASGSSIVTVTLPAHGLAVNDVFTFPISTTVGGVTIDGTYPVLSVPTADTFTISANVEASSTANAFMNGGDAQIVYYINLGPAAAGVGYGIGPYGVGGYGSGVTPTAQTGTPITATDWTTANWGELLLACPAGGGIYQWSPNRGFSTAGLISTAPIFNQGIFVSQPAQILVAYGSTSGAPGSSTFTASSEQQDPLLVRWSDSLDPTIWTVSSLTQAGSYHVPKGSKIVGALQGPQQGLLWTDIGLWAMSYIGPPLVFRFNELSAGCGLIGPHAACVLRGAVYWMSQSSFFVLAGSGVQSIPCSVWDVVFQDLDEDNQWKCVAAANSGFDEVWFFYPSQSGGGGENDRYVKYNVEERTWDYGTIGRSTWIDDSVLGSPLATTSQGLIYQHETSTDADGQPLSWSFQTGWFVIAEGHDFSFVDWFFPDMKFGYFNGSQNAQVLVTIYVTNYPNQTPRVFGPFTMTNAKSFINCRLRGRMVSLKFEGNDIGSFARLGNMRFRMAADGKR